MRIAAAADSVRALLTIAGPIAQAGAALRAALDSGHAVFTCGNGGSAAQALHLSEELIGKYKNPRPPIRAVCLNADPTAITCIANDFGFQEIFARQLTGLAHRGDILIALSTSGESENILRALSAACGLGITTIGLLGRDGGRCRALCDHALIVPATPSEHIQEAHQVLVHMLVEAAEGVGG
jgi:D-sedoheptulose 7-phosphate isomerase